ncbi:uncharacterized protein BCR38DRAFT_174911 [Pseudomassariella vexata]|uniref:Uncharacterized protein n=1 Tax=Pseudomassariella vexata TaxID=1141098 RepID=A0A1Y2E3R3_9PEZI|nr:uncharacterized protein BCR38DRAFT_174911 [Pseudomassariella vexata]ORY66198.1 hypothetical protein BCR38DRAFT_174911 [Pseudomassariella vexata]
MRYVVCNLFGSILCLNSKKIAGSTTVHCPLTEKQGLTSRVLHRPRGRLRLTSVQRTSLSIKITTSPATSTSLHSRTMTEYTVSDLEYKLARASFPPSNRPDVSRKCLLMLAWSSATIYDISQMEQIMRTQHSLIDLYSYVTSRPQGISGHTPQVQYGTYCIVSYRTMHGTLPSRNKITGAPLPMRYNPVRPFSSLTGHILTQAESFHIASPRPDSHHITQPSPF